MRLLFTYRRKKKIQQSTQSKHPHFLCAFMLLFALQVIPWPVNGKRWCREEKKKKKGWWETDCDIALGKGNGLKYVSVRQKMDRQLFSEGPFIFFSLQPFNCLYLDSRESVRIFNVPMWESHHVVGRYGQNQLLVRCERTNMNSII